MLNVLRFGCVLWAVLSMYVTSIKLVEYQGLNRRSQMPTVRNVTIALWLWRTSWITGSLAGLLVGFYVFQLFFPSRMATLWAWFLVAVFIAVKISLRQHVKFLVEQKDEFWESRTMPKWQWK